MGLIEAKAEGNEIAMPEDQERPAPVLDLMAALEASLARAQQDHPSSQNGAHGASRKTGHTGGHVSGPRREQPGVGAGDGRAGAGAGPRAGPRAGLSAGGRRAPPRWRSGRKLNLSNLDKVLWPATGTTKGDMVSYYAQHRARARAAPGRPGGDAEALPRWGGKGFVLREELPVAQAALGRDGEDGRRQLLPG